MPVIICEGPDGSGKSTLAAHLGAAFSLPVYPTMGPPKTAFDLVKRVKNILSEDNVIFDRFTLISEMVYGPILRDTHVYDISWLNRLSDPGKYLVIYCRPSDDTILNTPVPVKPHKPKPHIRDVIAQRKRIIEQYDYIMSKTPNKILYNRDTLTLDQITIFLKDSKYVRN